MTYTKLPRRRVAQAKRAFTTRRVPAADMKTLISGNVAPRPGNLTLASVYEVGKHKKIEKPNGRRALMLPGDEIIVCYGNRYAPDQFEALVCDDLSLCDLVAGGGIASREVNRHERMMPPTQIKPIGLIGDKQGRPINIFDYRVNFLASEKTIKVIVVAGTAMNSGKTFTAASIVRGLKAYGFRVAGIKATGTGSGGDLWQMKDMGADIVLDFTDAGFASTYKTPDKSIETGVLGLIYHSAERKCDFAIVEIADGLQHAETATLLRSGKLQHLTTGCVFAACDAMGAIAGHRELCGLGYNVLAVSGQLTRSPLAIREAKSCQSPIYTPLEIQTGALLPVLTGATDADEVTLLKKKYRETQAMAFNDHTLKDDIPRDDIVDYDTHPHPCVVRKAAEHTHAIDFPNELDETA